MDNQKDWNDFKMDSREEMNPILPNLFMPEAVQVEEDDFEQDFNYMKRMYPDAAKEVMGFVEDECDQLEYEGSCMFHEYPDKVTLQQISDRIYDKVKYQDEKTVEQQERGCRDCDGRGRGNNRNFLHDLVDVMLFNEMHNRRRRYNRRRRMFR